MWEVAGGIKSRFRYSGLETAHLVGMRCHSLGGYRGLYDAGVKAGVGQKRGGQGETVCIDVGVV